MSNFEKPVFSAKEIAEIEAGHIDVGYKHVGLYSGYDFSTKPFRGKLTERFVEAKEKLDGTAAKRDCHAQINSFGWARFQKSHLVNENNLLFGIKYSGHSSSTEEKVAKSVLAKYRQLLGYLLQQAGWKNIKADKEGDYVVPLDNAENIKLLYTLSPSIGFYYKVPRPTLEDLRLLEVMVAEYNAKKQKQEKTR